ncbi:MAG: hypothetical protein AAF569_08915 [Pseudomonadota bacterium]
MTHSCFEVFDKADDPEACKCKGIVLNAYGNLRAHGMPESEALKAASRILRHHHPSSVAESRNVVECWIFEHSRQAAN